MKNAITKLTITLILFIAAISVACLQNATPMVGMAKSGAEFASMADPTLRKYYSEELHACTLRAEGRETCVAEVKLRWAPIRKSLADLRTAWCQFEPAKCQAQDAANKPADAGAE